MSAQLSGELPRRQWDISVIIPTYNRHSSLLETLDSLSRQTFAASRFEVVVVDDGSTDATPEIMSMSYSFALRYAAQKNQGAAAARNHGAEISGGKVLIFIDDDITLEPGYLQAIWEAHHGERRLVSMGVFQPYLTDRDSLFAIRNARWIAAQADVQNDQQVSFTKCSSNNLAIERPDFFDVGMWRDVFGDGPTLWGDVEFGYRAWKQGFKFLKIADAGLQHRDCHVVNLQVACERAYHMSRTVHFLFQRHPEIAQHIPAFQDKHPISFFSDSTHLIAHKVFHMVTSCPPGLWTMERLARFLERKAPQSLFLGLLCRWIVSAHIYKGYRQGLRELAEAAA